MFSISSDGAALRDFTDSFGEFAIRVRLLRYFPSLSPYYPDYLDTVGYGLFLLTDVGDWGFTGHYATSGEFPEIGDIIEGRKYGYRIIEIKSIDREQVFKVSLRRFQLTENPSPKP